MNNGTKKRELHRKSNEAGDTINLVEMRLKTKNCTRSHNREHLHTIFFLWTCDLAGKNTIYPLFSAVFYSILKLLSFFQFFLLHLLFYSFVLRVYQFQHFISFHFKALYVLRSFLSTFSFAICNLYVCLFFLFISCVCVLFYCGVFFSSDVHFIYGVLNTHTQYSSTSISFEQFRRIWNRESGQNKRSKTKKNVFFNREEIIIYKRKRNALLRNRTFQISHFRMSLRMVCTVFFCSFSVLLFGRNDRKFLGFFFKFWNWTVNTFSIESIKRINEEQSSIYLKKMFAFCCHIIAKIRLISNGKYLKILLNVIKKNILFYYFS